MPDPTLKSVIEVFAEVVDVGDSDITEATVLGSDLAVDSREMLMILSRLEARFDVRLDPRQTFRIRTVADAMNAIRQARGS